MKPEIEGKRINYTPPTNTGAQNIDSASYNLLIEASTLVNNANMIVLLSSPSEAKMPLRD